MNGKTISQDSHGSFEGEDSNNQVTFNLSRSALDVLERPAKRKSSLNGQSSVNGRLQLTLHSLRTYEFDSTEPPHDRLIDIMVAVFLEQGLLNFLGLEEGDFKTFLEAIEKEYRANPYHNFRHAFDVFSCVYYIVTTGGAQSQFAFDTMDVLILLMSAIMHDIGHPGLNNAHLVSTRHPLALTYNDQSVLENYHAAGFFRLVFHGQMDELPSPFTPQDSDSARARQFNVIKNLSAEQVKRFREGVVCCVLETDMAKHMKFVADFKRSCNLGAGVGPGGEVEKKPFRSPLSPENKKLLMCMIVKSGDISNLTRPFSQCLYWCERLSEEFFLQGDRELALGMAPPPSFRRAESASPQAMAKSTIGFARFAACELFAALSNILPGCTLLVANLADNLNRFQAMADSASS